MLSTGTSFARSMVSSGIFIAVAYCTRAGNCLFKVLPIPTLNTQLRRPGSHLGRFRLQGLGGALFSAVLSGAPRLAASCSPLTLLPA